MIRWTVVAQYSVAHLMVIARALPDSPVIPKTSTNNDVKRKPSKSTTTTTTTTTTTATTICYTVTICCMRLSGHFGPGSNSLFSAAAVVPSMR
eukprot:13751496-Heterocapsa_arctica.AAC.1